MNREEARLELDATTLRPQDASPEAREMARSDAELAAWLEKRTAFDESVAHAFQGLSAPAAFKADLLHSMAQQAAAPVASRRGRSVVWGVASSLIAAAACVAVGWTLLWPSSSAMAAWEAQSLSAVAKVEYGMARLDEHASNYEAVRALLSRQEQPCPNAVPSSLQQLRTYGCKRISVEGRPATLICFQLAPGKEAHLVVMSKEGLCDCPADDKPCFKAAKNWRYASWSHNGQAFLLATTADEALLKQLFGLV